MAHIYIVKVFDGEAIEYEYSNLAHAKEHFAEEKSPCELIDYVWNSETQKRTYKLLKRK